jgi:predicted transcriptional regulator
MMKQLTKSEEQIMQILWEEEKGFVKDIVTKFENPQPAYNTVSTIIRILEKKEFVSHKAYGKTHEYFPIISKDEYSKLFLKQYVNDYFNNSFKKLVSFFSKEENLSIEELENIKKIAEELIEEKQKKE